MITIDLYRGGVFVIIEKLLGPKHIEAMYLGGIPISITLLSLGFIWAIISSVFFFNFDSSVATVIDYEVYKNKEGKYSYTAIVSYTMKNNKTRRSSLSMSSASKKYAIGSQLTILYKTSSPKLVFIKSFEGLFFAPLMILAFGILSALLSRHYKKRFNRLKTNRHKEASYES
jgi:hypothetical protein